MPQSAVRSGTIMLAVASTLTIAAGNDARAEPHLTPAQAVAGYCAAWNTTNRSKRDQLLREVFARDGVLTDPGPTYIRGRAALRHEIASFHRHYPGARFRCGVPQIHRGTTRLRWILLAADGKRLTRGMDFYQFAPNGQIRRVAGFVEPSRTIVRRP